MAHLQSAVPVVGSQLHLETGENNIQRRKMMRPLDDNMMINQILETHSPAGLEVDVNPLLQIVEDILNRAMIPVDATDHTGADGAQVKMDYNSQETVLIALIGAVSHTIDRISCEISYNALASSDAHSATISLLNMLSSYSWHAKLVLTLAAFALNYGEFWLLAQIHSSNQLAKSMAILKQLPSIFEHTSLLKPRFDALNNLIKGMMNVTRRIVELNELPSMYISEDEPLFSKAMAHVPVAVYWIKRSVIACATQISILTSMGYEYAVSTTEAWELSTLAHKMKTMNEHLDQQLAACYKYIEEKKNNEDYQMIVNLFEATQVDNMKILKALIYAGDDLQPLVDGSTKNRVNLNVLRKKDVLLLISDLDISYEELMILEQIYMEAQDHATKLERHYYEVVWIPIVDPSADFNDSIQKKFEYLQSTMPWYSVYHPNVMKKAVIKFIKEVWHFRNKPILVVIDPKGKIACPNAIHMMWIWASSAFPFTSSREEALWKDETWRLQLLVNGIDPLILQWIKAEKYIFLYGGDDIEWVRKFTRAARSIAISARIPIEMVYVGKSSKKEQVKRVIDIISRERLSETWDTDFIMIWFFWTRLESMLFSRIQLNKGNHRHQHRDRNHDHWDDDDNILQEIKKLLAYDKDNGWAVISKGSDIIVNAHGSTILPTLLDYENKWRIQATSKGFDVALKEYHEKIHSRAHPCCRLEFPVHAGEIPDRITCPECHRVMEKFTSFSCCRD